jgi:hypothetical protein
MKRGVSPVVHVLTIGPVRVTAAALAAVATLAGATGCARPAPTPAMSRSAALVLGVSVAEGSQRLGECLQAAGYDIDREEVEQTVKRGADVNSTRDGKPTAVYRVRIDGDEDLHFAVVSDSGMVVNGSDENEELLAKLGCSLR